MTPKLFIGKSATYDNHGQFIWGVHENGGMQKIIDLRGWGAIQNTFKDKNGNIDINRAEAFQDELGEWIASAINEKLQRELI